MRLLTWNLNGRRHIERQAAAVADRVPDIVALQELTQNSVPRWRDALTTSGMTHLIDSFAHAPSWQPAGPRRYGLLIASRFPLTKVLAEHPVPWPERVLTAAVTTPIGVVNLHTAHIPPGSGNGWMKVEMLEAVSAVVAETYDSPTVLCGDFNIPQLEMPDGRIITWGQEMVDGEPCVRGRWRGGPGIRWDAAERSVMEGGATQHLVDAFRFLHGYGREEFSWFVTRKERFIGRRFDHVFCSRELLISRCEYLHTVRERRLSDHSALELDFELRRA